MVTSDEKKSMIANMLRCGKLTQRDIAQIADCSKGTVSNVNAVIRKGRAGENVEIQGRPRKYDLSSLKKVLVKVLKSNRSASYTEIRDVLSKKYATKLSISSVRRVIKTMDWKPYMCRNVPYLTDRHRKLRVEWAKKHIAEGTCFEKWCFTDESWFFQNAKCRRRYWCKRGFIHCKRNAIGRQVPHEGRFAARIMIWGAISSQGKHYLHVFRCKRVRSQEYIALLKKAVPSIRSQMGHFVFQQDNARPHISKVTKSHMKSRKIVPIDWPARSPDLNPIENIWSVMKHRLRKMKVKGLEALVKAIRKVWREMSQEIAIACCNNMPARLQEVIARNGHIIDY